MSELERNATGVLTFVATDIVGSSALWEREFDAMQSALRTHDSLVHTTIEGGGGYVFKTTGDGCIACFPDPVAAAVCAWTIQASVSAQPWPTSAPLQLRVALHTGPTVHEGKDHFGPTVNRLARLLNVAEPGCTVLSLATFGLVDGNLPEGLGTRSAGTHALKGIATPVQVYELVPRDTQPTAPRTGVLPKKRVVGAWPSHGREFVGRKPEQQAVLSRIGDGGRLVTVTGPGGIGKSSLLCAVVDAATNRYPDGSVFVDCQSFESESEVALGIVQAFSGATGAVATEDAALDLLRERSLLLVLDCYESLADEAVLPSRILADCPGVDVLIGSRAVLGVERETEVSLGPMPFGTRGKDVGTAEQLFTSLARSTDSTFEDTPESQAEVRHICRLLDGVPLLLTLAAARMRHMGVSELREQIESQGTTRLTGTHRDLAERHLSVRNVVATSLRLLGGREVQVLSDLAVFRGGALFPDIAAVLAERHPELEAAVFRLRDHSLLLTETTKGRKRYRMLDTIRETVLEFHPTESDVRARHAWHYARRADQLASLADRGEAADARYLLLSETGNFRASADYAVEHGDASLVIRLFRGCAGSLQDAGLWDDYERLAAVARRVAGREVESAALGLDGALALRRGNRLKAARAWLQRAELCAELGDGAGRADALLDLAESALTQGNLVAAAQYCAQGLGAGKVLGEDGYVATAWAVGAELALKKGDVAAALRRAEAASAHADGSKLSIYVRLACGRVFRACGRHRESLESLLAGTEAARRSVTLLSLHTMLAETAHAFARLDDSAMEAVAWASIVELDRELGLGKAGHARKRLAQLSREAPSLVREATQLVKGSGWDAGVELMLSTP